MAKISQLEARRLKKRVAELELTLNIMNNRWAAEWPSGCHIDTIDVSSEEWSIVSTARKLKHACVVVPGDKPQLKIYGCPLPK